MSVNRISALYSILKGFLTALLITLAGMLAIAALAVFIRISDRSIMLLNQLLKLLAIISGTWAAVGRGGSRGFITGIVIAVLYMAIGYITYSTLGGSAWSVSDMLGEILVGAAVGGVAGAILANLPPRGKRRKRA